MPQPPANPNPIYWSREGQNFYQEGRSGVVPRLEAIQTLTVVDTPFGQRFKDQENHFTPDLIDLIPYNFNIPSYIREHSSTYVGDLAYSTPAGSGAFYTTLFIYKTPEGKLAADWRTTAIGDAIDKEVEHAKMHAAIGDALNIDRNSAEGGSDQMESLLSGVFHFLEE